MKTLLGCMGILQALVLAVGAGAYGETVDGIVATVGTEVILHSELVEQIAPVLTDLRLKAANEEQFNEQAKVLLGKALEDAVDNRILLREALLVGIDVDKAVVEQRVVEVKKRFASDAEFEKEMAKAGETVSDLRERVKKQILATSFGLNKRRAFEKEASVSEADIDQYYREHSDEFTHPERVRVRRVFLEAKQDASERAQVEARMTEIKKEAGGGADFATLAKTYSAGPEASDGGLVGWVTRDSLVKELADVAFSLAEGGVSDVSSTQYGLVILKVEKKEVAGSLGLDEARKQIEPQLRAKAADEKFKTWMTGQRKRSRVRIFLNS